MQGEAVRTLACLMDRDPDTLAFCERELWKAPRPAAFATRVHPRGGVRVPHCEQFGLAPGGLPGDPPEIFQGRRCRLGLFREHVEQGAAVERLVKVLLKQLE